MANFSFLSAEIFRYKEPIVLYEDVILDSSEAPSFLNKTFSDGIEIKSDNVIIEGNGHTIDANGKTRIFNVLGKNVVLKNIHFKNGFSKEFGGAIRNAGECEIINCSFENNKSKKSGHDISNGSNLSICHCEFLTNNSNNTINNKGAIYVLDTEKEDLKSLVSGGDIQLKIPQHKITFVLNGENVYLKNASVNIGDLSASTNIKGICDIEGVEEGDHLVFIEAKNYKPFTDSINVSKENTIFPFILEKIEKTFDIIFSVHDENGPIEGAIISFGDFNGITNNNGECIFNDVKEGKIFVNVDAKGYDSKTETFFIEEDNIEFDIRLGKIGSTDIPFIVENYDNPYIFSSYAHKDANEVFTDLKSFHDEGLDIWYDEGIQSGDGWQAVIEKALIDSSLFVVFISPSAVDSRHVREEIYLAKSEDIPIIPIFLEETELKHGLKLLIGSVQAIKKYKFDDENIYLDKCFKGFKYHEFL